MATFVEETSKITAKGQTTIPKAVRQALGVDYGGRIVFQVERHQVTVRRADEDDADPVVERFLAFLARDLEHRPHAIIPLDPDLAARLASLTGTADVDPDVPITGEVSL